MRLLDLPYTKNKIQEIKRELGETNICNFCKLVIIQSLLLFQDIWGILYGFQIKASLHKDNYRKCLKTLYSLT